MQVRRWFAPLALVVATFLAQGCASGPPGNPPQSSAREGVVMIYRVDPSSKAPVEVVGAYVHDPEFADRTWWVLADTEVPLPSPPLKPSGEPAPESTKYLKYVLVSATSPAHFKHPGRLEDPALVQWMCSSAFQDYGCPPPTPPLKVWVVDQASGVTSCP